VHLFLLTPDESQPMSVLVGDDEPSIVMLVRSELELAGYDVITAEDGIAAVTLAREHAPDLIVLDIMMPGQDGFAVCAAIRNFSNAPIIMLSARAQEQDKIAALNLGADDYMTKPFGVGELLARVRAAMRRSHGGEAPAERALLKSGRLVIDLSARAVLYDNTPIKLTATEFKLLCALVRDCGKTLLHDEILTSVWGAEYAGQVEYLWVYIGRLRRKLESNPDRPVMLVSVPGIGYRFERDGSAVATVRRI
jgi:two-component system KDP operon response regulator KdpE